MSTGPSLSNLLTRLRNQIRELERLNSICARVTDCLEGQPPPTPSAELQNTYGGSGLLPEFYSLLDEFDFNLNRLTQHTSFLSERLDPSHGEIAGPTPVSTQAMRDVISSRAGVSYGR